MSAKARIALQLRRTLGLLAFALVVLVTAGVSLGEAAAKVLFPLHGGALGHASRGGLVTHAPVPVRLGEVDATGVALELAIRDDATFLRARPCPEGASACELRLFERAVSPAEVEIVREAPGLYEVRVTRPCAAGDPLCDAVSRVHVQVRAGPHRSFHAPNLASPRVVPGLLAFVAFAAVAVGLARVRLGLAYARRLHTWREVTLAPGGMLEDEGTTLGVVDTTRKLRPGAVLVSPEALPRGATYRDLPVVAPGAVAQGSHASWASGTERRLRDARVLALLASGAVFASGLSFALAR